MQSSPVRRFWGFYNQYRKEFHQIYVFAIFNGIVNLSLPLGIQAIVNFIQAGAATVSWFILVGIVLVGVATNGIIQMLQLRILEDVQQSLFARSAFEFAFRLPKIRFLQLDRAHAPELTNRFFDTLTIQKGLPKIIIDFSLAAFQIVFGLLLLTIYNAYFIVLAIGLLFFLYVVIQVTGPKGLETSLLESKYKYRTAHWLEEIARYSRTFKLNASSDYHLNRTDEVVSGYLKKRESHFQVVFNQYRIFIVFKVLVAAALLFLGGYLVFTQQMNIGQFVASEIIIILIIASLEKVMLIIETIYDTLTGLEKIGYVTDLRLDDDGGRQKISDKKPIEVRATDITFSFPEERKPVIDELSFKVAGGEKVVLAGPSGSGKTVLLQLLAGIHPVQDGELYINNIPFATYNRDLLYEDIGVAYPTNQIFEGTFRDNITLGRPVTEQHLEEVLTLLHLHDYINHRPDGIDCFVDSGGRRLPRAIIQKLMIARVIITEPRLLLLEDPLLFMDVSEKRRIVDYIMDDARPWTVLVVSDFPYWEEKAGRTINLVQA